MHEDLPSASVLLLEPNAVLRSAIQSVLEAASHPVQVCDSLAQVLTDARGRPDTVALVAWQATGGLLADEQRGRLTQLTSRVRLVVMVPRRWSRLLDLTDLRDVLAGILTKPFESDELLATVQHAVEPTPLAAS